ncbi:hypothetical protein GCM10022221_31160 [Actinocorallia aurea]
MPEQRMIGSDGRLIIWQDGELEVLQQFDEPCEHGFVDIWHSAPTWVHRSPHGLIYNTVEFDAPRNWDDRHLIDGASPTGLPDDPPRICRLPVSCRVAEPRLDEIVATTPVFQDFEDGTTDRWAFPLHVSRAHKDEQGTYLGLSLFPDGIQDFFLSSGCGLLKADPAEKERLLNDPDGVPGLQRLSGDWFRACYRSAD